MNDYVTELSQLHDQIAEIKASHSGAKTRADPQPLG